MCRLQPVLSILYLALVVLNINGFCLIAELPSAKVNNISLKYSEVQLFYPAAAQQLKLAALLMV